MTAQYDIFGQLIAEDVNGTTTEYAVDGWNPAKMGATGTSNFDVWATFTSGGSLISRQIQGDGIDQHLAYVTSTNAYWYLTDHLGSTRAVINNSGTVQDSIAYDAYGNITYQTPSPSTTPLYTYTGRELDVETGLQYNRARWYDPGTGRWISQDPLGFDAGDSNLYRYVNNRPTIAKDPSGLRYDYRIDSAKSTIKIILNFDFYGELATFKLLTKWRNAITSAWDGKGKSSTGKEWNVVIDIKSSITTGFWSSWAENIIEVKAVGWSPRLSDGFFSNGDVNYGAVGRSWGRWSAGCSDFTIAHEAGHLMGFADYYTGSSDPRAGYAGTIMGEYGGTASKPGPDGRSFRDRLIDNVLEKDLNASLPINAFDDRGNRPLGIAVESGRPTSHAGASAGAWSGSSEGAWSGYGSSPDPT